MRNYSCFVLFLNDFHLQTSLDLLRKYVKRTRYGGICQFIIATLFSLSHSFRKLSFTEHRQQSAKVTTERKKEKKKSYLDYPSRSNMTLFSSFILPSHLHSKLAGSFPFAHLYYHYYYLLKSFFSSLILKEFHYFII